MIRAPSRAKVRKTLMQALANNLRSLRSALKFTQADVARMVGIAPDVYGRMERGTMLPSCVTLSLIASLLRTDPSSLLYEPEVSKVITRRTECLNLTPRKKVKK